VAQRRLFQAEDAGLNGNIKCTDVDYELKQHAEPSERLGAASAALLQHLNNNNPLSDEGVSDCLLRYETHLTRETDRILNQFERSRRMRMG
jgi:hypothetical protein